VALDRHILVAVAGEKATTKFLSQSMSPLLAQVAHDLVPVGTVAFGGTSTVVTKE
jgi:hypothetical protein